MAGASRPGSTRSPMRVEVAGLGAGEILLTSMDRDGTGDGFDLALTRADRRRGAGAGGRLRRRRHARPPRRRRARGPCLRRCSPPRSSISARSRSAQAKEHMAAAGLPVRLDVTEHAMSGFTLADLAKIVAERAARRRPPAPIRRSSVGRASASAPRSSARRRSKRRSPRSPRTTTALTPKPPTCSITCSSCSRRAACRSTT